MSIAEKEIGNKESLEWELPLYPLYRNGELSKYTGNVSLGTLADMYRTGKIIYNPLKQRGERRKADGSTEPYIIKSKVKEILNEILANRLHGNLITLNIRKEENPQLIYNDEIGILHGRNKMEIIDGGHRLTAGLILLQKWERLKEKDKKAFINPFEYEMQISVEILSDDDSVALFSEYNSKQTKVNKNVTRFLDVYDLSNTVARRLMNESELRGKIQLGSSSLKAKGNNSLTTFSTIYEGIKNNFRNELTTKKEADKVADYLISFWNEIINLLPEYMGEMDAHKRALMRDVDLTIQQITFNAYFAIARKLYELEDWKKKLAKIKEPVQVNGFKGYLFSKDNPWWIEVFRIKNGKPMVVNSSSTIRTITKQVVNYIVPEESKNKE